MTGHHHPVHAAAATAALDSSLLHSGTLPCILALIHTSLPLMVHATHPLRAAYPC